MRSFNSFVEDKHIEVLVDRSARIMEEQGIDPDKYLITYIQENHPDVIDENWFSRLGSSLGNTWQTMKSGWMANPKQDLATIKKHLDHWTGNLAQYDQTGQLKQAATQALAALKDLPIDQISKDVQTRYIAKNPQAAQQQQTNPQVKPGPGPQGTQAGTTANPITDVDVVDPNKPEAGVTKNPDGTIDVQGPQGNQGGVLDAAPQTPQGTPGVGQQNVAPQQTTQGTSQQQVGGQVQMPQSDEEWEQLKQKSPEWYNYLKAQQQQPQVAHNEPEGEMIQEWVDTAKRLGIG